MKAQLKKKVKMLEKEDKELARLPKIEKEEKVFKKSEGILKRLLRPQPVEFDIKKMKMK
jgi:hypothetical protein